MPELTPRSRHPGKPLSQVPPEHLVSFKFVFLKAHVEAWHTTHAPTLSPFPLWHWLPPSILWNVLILCIVVFPRQYVGFFFFCHRYAQDEAQHPLGTWKKHLKNQWLNPEVRSHVPYVPWTTGTLRSVNTYRLKKYLWIFIKYTPHMKDQGAVQIIWSNNVVVLVASDIWNESRNMNASSALTVIHF